MEVELCTACIPFAGFKNHTLRQTSLKPLRILSCDPMCQIRKIVQIEIHQKSELHGGGALHSMHTLCRVQKSQATRNFTQTIANTKLLPNVPNKEDFFLIWHIGLQTKHHHTASEQIFCDFSGRCIKVVCLCNVCEMRISLIGYFGHFKSKLYFFCWSLMSRCPCLKVVQK